MITSQIWPNSVAGDFRNLRLAGVLKKRSRTSTLVPVGQPPASGSPFLPPSTRKRRPSDSLRAREMISSLDTEAILGSASPRNPKVATRKRSASSFSLLVECLSRATGKSSALMPSPSSLTRIKDAPLPSTQTEISLAPASRAFSSNSLTTEAGRSTTSPAAMRVTQASGRRIIFTALYFFFTILPFAR